LLFPLALLGIVGLGLAVVWWSGLRNRVVDAVGETDIGKAIPKPSGLLGHAGIAAGDTDIRKVTADPQAYAGQTLKSRVIMEGSEQFRGIGAIDAVPLSLMASSVLEEKAMNILQCIGSHQAIMIKYRIHDRTTFAKIKAYEDAEEKAKAHDDRILEAGTRDGARDINVAKQVDQMREAREKAREKEVGEKDPADYSGVLLDIWIP